MKVTIIGIEKSGKTELSHCLMKMPFSSNCQQELSAAYYLLLTKITNSNVTIGLWDTPGQETLKGFLPIYTRNCNMILCALDPTMTQTKKIDEQLQYCKDIIEKNNTALIVFVLNKCDEKIEETHLTSITSSIETFKQKLNTEQYQCSFADNIYQTSAKNNDIADLNQFLAEQLLEESKKTKEEKTYSSYTSNLPTFSFWQKAKACFCCCQSSNDHDYQKLNHPS